MEVYLKANGTLEPQLLRLDTAEMRIMSHDFRYKYEYIELLRGFQCTTGKLRSVNYTL